VTIKEFKSHYTRRYVVMKGIFPVVLILQMTAIGRPEALTIMP
jgi:hypothetical protein